MIKRLLYVVALMLGLATLADADTGQGKRGSCKWCHNGALPLIGTSITCGSCHANPPTTGAHRAHTDGIGAIYGSDADNSVSTAYRFNCGNCHALDPAKHGNSITDLELYNAAAIGFKKNNPATADRSGTGNATVCNNIYCHSSGQNSGVNSYASTPLWGSTFSGNHCASCHSYPPDYANNAPKANSHPAHNQYYTCNTCHAGTTSDGATITNASLHVNHSYDLAPGGSGVTFTYTYAPTGGTCSNISCHTSATWGAGCNVCHGNPPPNAAAGYTGINEATSPHMKHAGRGANYSYACGQCHKGNNHNNGTFQDVFIDKSGIIAGAAAAYTAATRTCSTLYCHSDGTSAATGLPASGSVVWGTGNLSCSGCHGSPPAYVNGSPKANSHVPHNYSCNTCHAGTTTDGTTITNLARHVNKAYDLVSGFGASFIYTYAPTGGTCSTISCHNNGTATWGGTLGCDGCHDAPPATASHMKHYGGTVVQAGYGNTGIAKDITTNATVYIMNCGNCHPMDVSKHGNGVVDMELYNPLAPAGSLKSLNPASAVYVAGSTVFTDARGINYTNGTCSSVYCHSYNARTTTAAIPENDPDWQAKVVVTRKYLAITWGSAPLTCSGCHGNPTQTSFATNDGGAGDSHSWIDSYGYQNLHTYNMGATPISCRYCHNDTVKQLNTYTAGDMGVWTLSGVPISNFSKHVNGVNDVSFDKQNPFVYSTYGGDVSMSLANATYDNATKNCSNVSCHIQETTVKWGTPYRWWNSYECDRCHNYM